MCLKRIAVLIISIPIDTDLLQRKPLLLRSVLSVFQNFFFPECGVYLLKNLSQKFCCFFLLVKFPEDPSLINILFQFKEIVSRNVVVVKESLLKLRFLNDFEYIE